MGTPRPHRTPEKDVLGRTISVSGNTIEARATAPVPACTGGGWKARIDAAVAAAGPAPHPMQYVICVRHPDDNNRYHTYGDANADGRIEVIDIDLGAGFDGHPDSDEQLNEWVDRRLTEAATVTDSQARARLLEIVSSVVDDSERGGLDVSEARAAISYTASLPARRVDAFQLALHCGPDAIRDHFEGEDSPVGRWVADASDAELLRVTDAVVCDDRIYQAWHEALEEHIASSM